ncbi:MAG: hypothetical protein ACOH2E_08295 [Candidatus Paracaedibacter sp.]
MMRKLFVKIARVAGLITLIAAGVFLYKADAHTSSAKDLHTYSSYTETELQPLETHNSDMLTTKSEINMDRHFPESQTEWDKTDDTIDRSRLWSGVNFPVDDYDGLELGRKIGNWIVKKIGTEKTND